MMSRTTIAESGDRLVKFTTHALTILVLASLILAACGGGTEASDAVFGPEGDAVTVPDVTFTDLAPHADVPPATDVSEGRLDASAPEAERAAEIAPEAGAHDVAAADAESSPPNDSGVDDAQPAPDATDTVETLPDVPPELAADAAPEADPDLGADAAPDLPPDVPPDLPPDVVVPVDPADALFDPTHVVAVDLTLPPSSRAALFVDPRTWVPATVTLTVPGEAPETLAVGVHLKGKIGSFQDLNGKAAFKIKFTYQDKTQRYRGLKGLTLNNMVQDRAMLHETLAMRIFRAFAVPAARSGFAWVTVNGVDYGLYFDVETYDDVFLKRHFASTQHLYQGEYGADVTSSGYLALTVEEGDEGDLLDLQAMVAAANDSPDETWMQALAPVVDLDELLREWAVEQYIGHWDGYSTVVVNNYWMHSDDDGVFSLLPWDTDQTFEDTRDVHSGNGYLFVRCMGIAACRARFDQTLQDLMALLDTLDLDAFVQQLAELQKPYVEADPRKPYSNASVAATVQSTRDFLAARRVTIGALVDCLLDPAADQDGDGHACDHDCDETDPTTYLGAPEICGDSRDQDCSGHADDGLQCPDCVAALRGPHRYLVCPVPRTWDAARAHCQENGSDLVVVNDAVEDAWVRATVLERGFWTHAWLGLGDAVHEGTFTWVDGTPLTFSAFAPGEPNDWGGNEDCAEVYPDGGWNDLTCTGALGVVCEDACAPGQDDDGDGALRCGDDCDDGNAAVHPGAFDLCTDGLDNDCDGAIDNGPLCLPLTTLVLSPLVTGAAFALLNDLQDRAQAHAVCAAAAPGADLAWLATPAQAAALTTALAATAPGVDAWIGLNDQTHEGLYLWPDATVTQVTTWAPGQPDNGEGASEQDCVVLQPDGRWDDVDCAGAHRALCRIPLP